MKKRVSVVVGVGMTLLAVIAIGSQPTLSRPDIQTRLRDFGVPADAELIAAGQSGDGKLHFAEWRDSSGKVHTKNTAPRPTTDR